MKILILCTGNSCRSQMAEGFLRSFDPELYVFSAGTSPSHRVHIRAIKAMREAGIDISGNKPESVETYLNESFNYVITVCSGANESCPAFTGKVNNRLHFGFEDPAEATGSEEEIMQVFREIRDKIKNEFNNFYTNRIKS